MAIPEHIDIALVLDSIRPRAAWRMSGTYQALVDTWEDENQTLPTEQEIIDAWPATQQKWADIADEPTPEEILEVLLDDLVSRSDPRAVDLIVRKNKAKVARGQ